MVKMTSWHDMNNDASLLSSEKQQSSNNGSRRAEGSSGKEQPAALTGNDGPTSAMKRLACNPCRGRKVRCDRAHPACGRAENRLAYNGQSPVVEKADQFNNISWSELAVDSQPQPSSAPILASTSSSLHPVQAISDTGQSEELTEELLPYMLQGIPEAAMLDDWANLQDSSDASDSMFGKMDFDSIDFLSGMMPSSTTNSLYLSAVVSPSPASLTNTNTASSDAGTRIQTPSDMDVQAVLTLLHDTYFDVHNPVFPMVHRRRFVEELDQAPGFVPAQALSLAMAGLGSLAREPPFEKQQSGDDAMVVTIPADSFYTQARGLLDMCEREDNGAGLRSIDTLQACNLLAFYELQRPNLARTWMTLGRAIRLAKLMGLERTDVDFNAFEALGEADPRSGMCRSLRVCLPRSNCPFNAEEKRRTFWQMYVLDTFASMRTKFAPAVDETVLRLPCAGELDMIDEVPVMPTVQEVLESPESHQLPPYAGVVVMATLYRRVFEHIQKSLEDSSYSFWDNHYRIDRLVGQCRIGCLAAHIPTSNSAHYEALSLIIAINLSGAEIVLHHVAIAKAAKEKLPIAITGEAISRCMAASTDLLTNIHVAEIGSHAQTFRQAGPLSAWAINSALQMHLWLVQHGPATPDLATQVRALRLVSDVMREFVGPQHRNPDLLAEVEAVLVDRERSKIQAQARAVG
ncbi:fungal specific transcription factor domain-containing protein [Colletotrichum graminicola M1.001]|uniref:Fungal specific transcription factor domain-containing protein n=1 Tax=Colletotrichum graminicola (strain M1.001 / M2 / FGSC 10212) TaxID=645133 RepID=E3QYK2_COLGM|nr:fungal specific transcription factor domain-containing protein [Colletotrichum graminicola M1.001]EFQ35940.1 fungal specific transcription factor domain-containing protein [Colletotrichum graminicola M1.001]